MRYTFERLPESPGATGAGIAIYRDGERMLDLAMNLVVPWPRLATDDDRALLRETVEWVVAKLNGPEGG